MKNPKEEIKEIRKNTKSIKGSAKNALKASNLAPTPLSKIITFSVVLITPILFYLFIGACFIVIAAGMVSIIVINDPTIGYNNIVGDGKGGANNNNRNPDVPSAVKGKFLMSWNTGNVTSKQGMRTLNGVTAYHRGLDLQPLELIATDENLAMYPMYPGTVEKVSTLSKPTLATTYGNVVIMKHTLEGKNFYVLYAHLKKVYVKEGDEIGYNTKVGRMGCTGRSFGSFEGCGTHLHMEILSEGYETTGISRSNVLQVVDYIACGDKKLENIAKRQGHCVDYRTELLGGKP